MDFKIRHIRRDERRLLEDFFYEAIFVPEDFEGEVCRDPSYMTTRNAGGAVLPQSWLPGRFGGRVGD